jgi:hypothetical protein
VLLLYREEDVWLAAGFIFVGPMKSFLGSLFVASSAVTASAVTPSSSDASERALKMLQQMNTTGLQSFFLFCHLTCNL